MLLLLRCRLSVCLVVTLSLLLVPTASPPAPVLAQTATPVATPAAVSDSLFLADGAHLAPGVTLRLAALGRGDALTPIDAVMPTDDGTRAAYAHGDTTEWYLRQGAQGAGIEQGITLATPPAGDGPSPSPSPPPVRPCW